MLHIKKTTQLNLFFILSFILQINAFAGEAAYTQPCRVVNEDDYVQYKIISTLQEKKAFSLTITAFEDEKCNTPYLIIDRVFFIESIQDERLNLKTEKIVYTSLSQEVSEALKLASYCGLKNWKTKIAQDVTGLKCDNYHQLKKSEIFYQILKTENNTLLYGNDLGLLNGRSEINRPVQFDLPFKKNP